MKSTIGIEETMTVGHETVIGRCSPSTEYEVVFEDDGETGYLYGLDNRRDENRILDALHIYNVSNAVDREKPSLVKILWSQDGLKAALLINEFPHAVFDFAAKRGYCRTNFPPFYSSAPDWPNRSKEWNEDAMDLFR